MHAPDSCQFILASASPRRAELLARYGFRYRVRPADIDETPQPGEAPEAFVRRLAQAKAAAVNGDGLPVLAADTVVVVDGRILGKPADRADGLQMLARLSGGGHTVLSGVCVVHGGHRRLALSETRVEFAPISPRTAAAYWASGEPEGKAGGYAIQGLAEAFVERIDGSYSGVVGLPLSQTLALLKWCNVQPPALAPDYS